MLRTITKSSNKKLGNCASTYRSGSVNVFKTCPSTCTFKPSNVQGSNSVDYEYLEAVKNAVPPQGVSWTYTHFEPEERLRTSPGQTCINISTESIEDATKSYLNGFPTVVVMPSDREEKVTRLKIESNSTRYLRVIRCPAEYSEITCADCGGETPLCARTDRDFVIKFTAHGSQKKTVNNRLTGSESSGGGCYGTSGPVRLQWEKTKGVVREKTDAEAVVEFAQSLPIGTKLRHHVVGDFGVDI